MAQFEATTPQVGADVDLKTRIKAHLSIARFDHWTKNVFIIPGIVVALSVSPTTDWMQLAIRIVIGFLSAGIIASSNYVVNEILDAPFDRMHPTKRMRPVACGLVNVPLGYAQWILMMVIGLSLAWQISFKFTVTMAVLWIMGCLYNIPPIRTKDLPFLDVLSESVNNPLRMLAGWYIATDAMTPPASLLVSYWMVGCYLMALKRFSELREIADRAVAGAYRKSFRFYTERSLLVSVMFYASTSMLFLGAFIIRYRVELIIAFPALAIVMALYYHMSFDPNSAAQNPEHLHRHKPLMISVAFCAILLGALMFIDIPQLYEFVQPTMPVGGSHK